jgi:hypothetical protein
MIGFAAREHVNRSATLRSVGGLRVAEPVRRDVEADSSRPGGVPNDARDLGGVQVCSALRLPGPEM